MNKKFIDRMSQAVGIPSEYLENPCAESSEYMRLVFRIDIAMFMADAYALPGLKRNIAAKGFGLDADHARAVR